MEGFRTSPCNLFKGFAPPVLVRFSQCLPCIFITETQTIYFFSCASKPEKRVFPCFLQHLSMHMKTVIMFPH